MRLNTLKPPAGSKHAPKRLGRGHASGTGKTSGRGHKGQHARSGGYHKVGFEGGQMPLQRRLPKVGFASRSAGSRDEIRLDELARIVSEDGPIDLLTLKKAGKISQKVTRAKVILAGEINVPVTIKGLGVTKGARAAIEKAGGTIED